MSGKIESFIREYKAFKEFATSEQLTERGAELIQLFAIHRKDERSNGFFEKRQIPAGPIHTRRTLPNDGRPITESQKAYIRDLLRTNGVECDDGKIESMTKEEASEFIDSLKGEG